MSLLQLWQTALIALKPRLNTSSYDHYLLPTSMLSFENDIATIQAPNPFTVNTLQSRFANDVERALSEIVGRRVKVVFELAAGSEAVAAPRAPRPRPVVDRPQPVNQQRELTASAGNLQPNLTFDTYVVGSSNRMAHAAAGAIAERPGSQYNPFFMHGGVGLGKTHLMHAIGHKALEINPNLRVMYVSSEMFTNDVINAIRHQRMDDFRERYRTIDLLMVDDIQFIAGKESTQEEFFHTFNALQQAGKQVIVSSDKPPRAIAALEERMRSRFAGGLVADVQSPDFEMRTAILRAKAEERNAHIGDDVLEYIARRDQTNIRELEGALTKLLMVAQLYNRPLTLQLAMEALSDGAVRANQQITANDVLQAVCSHFSLEEKELLGRGRARTVSFPRQVAMYLMRKDADISLEEIGQTLRRDHTTVLHGIRKIEAEMARDATLRNDVMSIRERLLQPQG
jgi:chromosomal replication initiator protein